MRYSTTRPNLVDIFNDTQKQNKFTYADYVRKSQINSTIYDFSTSPLLEDKAPEQNIIFMPQTGTLESAERLVNEGGYGKIAILNFADALTPGGLVLSGATTQEENICRCSTLYDVISSSYCKKYYDTNRKFTKGVFNHEYTDMIIYSPDIVVYKDDITYENIEPYIVDVITCPAPCKRLSSNAMHTLVTNRIRKLLASAQLNNVDTIILGAWGCGAFGNDVQFIASCFAEELMGVNAFKNVVFAIRGSLDTYTLFKSAFLTTYEED